MREVISAANYILKSSMDNGYDLTPIHIIRLVYFSYSWHLAITGKPLIVEYIEAWRFGPIIRSVYDEFKKYGNEVIRDFGSFFDIKKLNFIKASYNIFNKESEEIMDSVVKHYAILQPFQLSFLATKEGTPWHQIYEIEGKNSGFEIISNPIMESYFIEMSQKNKEYKVASE